MWYNVPTDVAGFQFDLVGNTTFTGAAGGEAAAAGFQLSATDSRVLGFSFTAATIAPDCGVLLSLDVADTAQLDGLNGIVFSDASSQNIGVGFTDRYP